MDLNQNESETIYEIQVEGVLDQDWEMYFEGLSITPANTREIPLSTTLIGRVTDQVALRGMLCKLWDLNLTLISVNRIGNSENEEQKNGE